jgi:hypothetical protein
LSDKKPEAIADVGAAGCGEAFQNPAEPWMAERSTPAMDGGSADFAGAKICQGRIHSVFWKASPQPAAGHQGPGKNK